MDDTKDIVLNGSRYQISRMDAAVGSWLLFRLIDSIRKIFADGDQTEQQPVQELDQSQKEAAANAMISGMLMTLDKDDFVKVQREALKVVGQYAAIGEKEVVLPVLMASGGFAVPALKNDIVSTVQLTSSSLYFNLSPFFLGDGLKGIFPQP
jgi:hypothetical protein